MHVSTKAIVLSKLKYRDSDLIVRCYTEALGVVSFLLRGVLNTRKGSTKTAYFQLLSQLDLVILYKEKRTLHTIKEVKANYVYATIHTNVYKSAIAMFIAELLTKALREEEENNLMYSYLETTLQWLDSNTNYANFHLLFLLKLTKYLGFYPDDDHLNFEYFDLQEGKFVAKADREHIVSGQNIDLLKQLLGTTFDAIILIKINTKQRQAFLNLMLRYYEFHLGNFKPPKSMQILNQVFS